MRGLSNSGWASLECPGKAILRALDVTTSVFSTLLRLGVGGRVGATGPRSEKHLELYEFESCPHCRKVREALAVLDLDALIFPCPKGGPHFREEVKRRGGKAQFPYLVDPNTGVEMYESGDIVAYLFDRYGTGKRSPLWFSLGPVNTLSGGIAAAIRPTGWVCVIETHMRTEEAAQSLRIRGLTILPHRARVPVHARDSLPTPQHRQGQRQAGDRFVERTGQMMVPFLSDPEHGDGTVRIG